MPREPRWGKAELLHNCGCTQTSGFYLGITVTCFVFPKLCERQVRFGPCVKILTGREDVAGWKGWRLTEAQYLLTQQEATAVVALPTEPSHPHKSEVEVLEMAAVLIKWIYSIDINSHFSRVAPVWKRCPTPRGGSLPIWPGTCSPSSPEPLTASREGVSSATGSREQRALQDRDSAPIFQKCWGVQKLTGNLSSLSLINVTGAVKVLTVMIKTYYLFPDFNWTLPKRHTNRSWFCLDWGPHTAQVNFYSD